MAKTVTRTIRKWSSQITDDDINEILKDFPDYVKDFRYLGPSSGKFAESYGHDKLIIRAHYWHNEWADPTVEEYARYYDPKSGRNSGDLFPAEFRAEFRAESTAAIIN